MAVYQNGYFYISNGMEGQQNEKRRQAFKIPTTTTCILVIILHEPGYRNLSPWNLFNGPFYPPKPFSTFIT